MTEIEQAQIEVSNTIDKDIVKIATSYSEYSILNPELVKELLLHVKLLSDYNLSYIKNDELIEIINILNNEFNRSVTTIHLFLCVTLDYLNEPQKINFEKEIIQRTVLNAQKENFHEVYYLLNILYANPKIIFEKMFQYLFNMDFLKLEDKIQIETIYKVWNYALSIFNDIEAFNFAYKNLLKLFHQALHYKKTETAFWLYYNPLHYFKSGTAKNTNISNEEFKHEVEKPLEKYIKEYIIPKHNIVENKNNIEAKNKIKVAFVMQRIIRHSTVNVFYSLIKILMNENSNKFEFLLYDLSFPESGGSNESYVKEFKELGITYINLHEKIFNDPSPTYSLLEKCIKTREILINDQIDILIGLHTRIEYIFLYLTRTAPKQIYWYHNSNDTYDIEGIDYRLSHGSIPKNDFNFRKIDIYKDISYYNPKININEINKIKNQLPEGSYILGSIGRLIKIEDKKYLKIVAEILKENPHAIYLACGSGDTKKISEMIEELEIRKEQFIFTGHVDSHLYGNILDLFLVPINGGGEALEEYRYKGKPYVALHKENLLDKDELKSLINAKEKNERLVIKDKNSMLFEPSLYNDKNLDFLIENQYIDKINKNAQMYYAISFAETNEEYIKIANEFISNQELCSKTTKDLMYIYMNKDRNCDFEKFLEEII